MTATRIPDFEVENHGTIFLLRPLTAEAREWVDVYLEEGPGWWGSARVVEHRYIEAIVEGIVADGLEVQA